MIKKFIDSLYLLERGYHVKNLLQEVGWRFSDFISGGKKTARVKAAIEALDKKREVKIRNMSRFSDYMIAEKTIIVQ